MPLFSLGSPTRSWFKGSDTTAVVLYLESFLEKHTSELATPDPYLDSILGALKNANVFLSTLYKSGLFLDRHTCKKVAQSGLNFLRFYSEAAQQAYDQQKTRFKLNPKNHAFIHIVDRLVQAYDNEQIWAWNPLTDSTQMDEDFIGKIASLSQAASTRTVHMESISRYLINCWRHLEGRA